MKHILDLSKNELKGFLISNEEKAFRANQIHDWIYNKKVVSLEEMKNIPKSTKQLLENTFDFSLPKVYHKADAADGTTKLLFKNAQNRTIETVIMRYDGRTSLCVSSQVGCKLACTFCQTGKLGFVSHLTTAEILAQFITANRILEPEGKSITHVVFMGMGEPLDNYDNVVNAANKLILEDYYNLSHRRVTISTSGIVPKIHKLIHDCSAALAVSLHSATPELRTDLMPINKKYDLSDLKKSLIEYQKQTGKKITLEFILIKDKNCTIQEAKSLVQFTQGLKVKVNLIPFNAHPGLPHQKPNKKEIEDFQKYLSSRSIPAPVRYSKGLEVSGACGQLAAKQDDWMNEVPNRKNLI